MDASVGAQTLSTRASAPAFSLGSRRSGSASGATLTPGPAAFDVAAASTAVRPSSPAAGFGTSKRPDLATDRSPGPASTRIPGVFGRQASSTRVSSPAFTLSGRPERSTSPSDLTPGPGAYDLGDAGVGVQATSARVTSPSFTMRPRRPISATETERRRAEPSPLSYSPSSAHLRSSPAFSLAGRDGAVGTVPGGALAGFSGPRSGLGSQPVAHRASAPAFSMGVGRDSIPAGLGRTLTPGPADHQPLRLLGEDDVVRPRSPAYSLGSRRDTEHGRRGALSPGPADYSTRPASAAPAFGFGTDRGRETSLGRDTGTPGPGAFDIPSAFGARTVFNRRGGSRLAGRESFGSAVGGGRGRGTTEEDGTPGPGRYLVEEDAGVRRAAKGGSFGRASRPSLGPSGGSSSASSASSASSTSTTGGRDAGPSPLSYAVRTTAVHASSPAFSMSGRTPTRGTDGSFAGPALCRTDSALGRQVVSWQRTAPTSTFGRETRFRSHGGPESPGPAAYGPKDRVRAVR